MKPRIPSLIAAGLAAALVPVAGCARLKDLPAKAAGLSARGGAGASDLRADCGEAPCSTLPYTRTVSSARLFDLYASGDRQLGALASSVKFFVDDRQSATPAIYYMNGNHTIDGTVPEAAELHYRFAQAYLHIPEPAWDYNQVTYFTNDKTYFAGSVQRYHLDDEGLEVYGVQFFPQDVIAGATIVKALRFIASSFHIDGAAMAFVATGEQQDVTAVAEEIRALGFRVLTISDVLGKVEALPLNQGEALGYLRLFPASQDDLRPTDIPVFDELPLDLTVVAGVITRAYQDPNSHVNLKSRQRRTPNLVLRSATADHPRLAPFADQPVRLRVTGDGFTIEAATAAEVRAALEERLARPWKTMAVDEALALTEFDDMCPVDPAMCLPLKGAFGAKAANLGFLAQPQVLGRVGQPGALSTQLGYDLSPRGFAVPMTFYQRFVDDPANAAVRAAVDAVIAAERGGDVSPAERRRLAQAARLAVLAGRLPEGLGAAVRDRLALIMPGAKRVKVRSSANAEDTADFNGAGLYDSFRATPALPDAADLACAVEFKMNKRGTVRAKVVPDTVECAIRAAWASLWNDRAVAERTYARLDHATAAMGLAVVPAYDLGSKIDANAVVLTRVSTTDDLGGYSLSVQNGNNLVTNPAPGTWSELGVAVMLTEDVPTSLTTLRHARPDAGAEPRTTPVISREATLTLVEIARTVETAWCRADPNYYPGAATSGRDCRWTAWDDEKPNALDFEFKLRKDGQWVCKQVR